MPIKPIHISLILASVPIIISIVVALIKKRSHYDSAFEKYAKSIYSNNSIEQITSAILLRDFLKKRNVFWFITRSNHTKETKNLMVVLLRTQIPITLQKTIADGFSYANDLNGQDMQYINMLNALIKPESCIKYELSGHKRYKRKMLSMKKADFFHAIIQESSINSVDATKAVFFCSNLRKTSFHNCIFTETSFKCAD